VAAVRAQCGHSAGMVRRLNGAVGEARGGVSGDWGARSCGVSGALSLVA
jgi:hypothetical protein